MPPESAVYSQRHLIERATRPEVNAGLLQLIKAAFSSDLGSQRIQEVFTVASLAAGCVHCQSHGAYGLHLEGVATERITALWDFETSELFDGGDRAALRFARDAATAPSAVTAEHHVELREHFTDAQIADLLSVICAAGWLNRWNDALATVTDQESVDWAQAHLEGVGWRLGKHAGEPEEQRPMHPTTARRLAAERRRARDTG